MPQASKTRCNLAPSACTVELAVRVPTENAAAPPPQWYVLKQSTESTGFDLGRRCHEHHDCCRRDRKSHKRRSKDKDDDEDEEDRKRRRRRKERERSKEKEKEERRSVLTGKKIKLKVKKEKGDDEREANRRDLLQFLNSM
ncbi:hypothetical protein B0H15DRAFT_839020 [Mycena belliarum]|uniref:Uncharacterized protein n=1 Tax=Mycena belliarum TaxID=1033014 RepID=A0AAD6XMV7_9AGAR|nr:hypothetical protein B0H15DRAFT_839020 [Mycena belliae]